MPSDTARWELTEARGSRTASNRKRKRRIAVRHGKEDRGGRKVFSETLPPMLGRKLILHTAVRPEWDL
ncbi:Kinesin-Like Protein Kif26A [Manis pentadactyla]|nr:Kinesin-Like Protein Kif26A [Manis pentadactyla]